MIALSGAVGMGKTCLFNKAAAELTADPDKSPIFIYVRNFYKEKLTIGGIMTAIILDLSDEAPRRDLEARSRQVTRLMGVAHVRHKRNICVVIEEAHRLHYNTLRSIKELREAAFDGVSPLFSCVVIGHPELAMKLEHRKEVYWRSALLDFSESNGWMTFRERNTYLKNVYGDAIEAKPRERIAALMKAPLQMDFFIREQMEKAYHAGRNKITEECLDLTPLELKKALGVSLGEIATEAGIGKTTVHEALMGLGSDKTKKAVEAALEKLSNQKIDQERIAI
jgi:hypothetical protein